MPYSGASAIIAERIQEARELRALCADTNQQEGVRRSVRGLIYVVLFGMYEAVVAHCVSSAIGVANGCSIAQRDLKPGAKLFALRSLLASYRDVGPEKAWEKGLELFRTSASSDVATLANVFPADGSFMRPSQLHLIWSLFELQGDPWPQPRHIGRINEIVDARNDVAHGAVSAAGRGRRLTDTDMDERIDDAEALCVYIVGAFSAQLSKCGAFSA